MSFSDSVLAAMIGAGATLFTALLNLRLSWKKELKERERGQPITKKTRRGPVLAIFLLMLACAIGGFAFSQYLMAQGESEARDLQAELRATLSEISAVAKRLEQVSADKRGKPDAPVQRSESQRPREEGVTVVAGVAPCKPRQSKKSAPPCAEQDAAQVSVCAQVPLAAQVKDVALYTRFQDSQQPWSESAVAPGQDAGQARFQDKYFEQPDGAATKQVCSHFANWNGEKARLARIVVKYAL
jgi:hypothetical protein